VVSEHVLGAAVAAPREFSQIDVLLIEDDDGDALIVQELLQDEPVTADAPAVRVQRARSLAAATPLLPQASCVLLDLGLPDATGLDGIRWLQEQVPDMAVVVLTGLANELLGAAAVRSGAQDYLVKGHVDGTLLNRVIRYAVERRRAEEAQRALHTAQMHAQENARLERGLLPSPLLTDSRLSVAARCLPGGKHMLLGGDFYDVVETSDGWVHALIGDVCGRGPAEAALGVCLRVAWRTMVLARRPPQEILDTLSELLEHERHDDTMFATMCMLSVTPARDSGVIRMAGHLPPILVNPAGVGELQTPFAAPLGLSEVRDWPGTEVRLDEPWSVLLFTDGLIEGRIGKGSERLGSEGLIDLIAGARNGGKPVDEEMLDRVIDQVRELNGGDLEDDLAVLALAFRGTDQL
jgi:serine phosphatase RsbU (regulator of sigma subunit)